MLEESREFEVRDELKEKRSGIKEFNDLVAYLEDVENNYNIGYGEAPRAIAQATLATAWYLANKFGITGFQAGFVMWDFVFDWTMHGNQCGAKLVDYDNMLYPQYDDKFEKTISSDTFKRLQEVAKKNLAECKEAKHVHPAVKAHWESIVAGVVPFGYTIKD